MGGTGAQGFLGALYAGVNHRAVTVRGNVQKATAIKIAVDVLGLGLEGCRYSGGVAPAGCQDQAGHHAQGGVNLADQFQAGFLAGGGVHAAHNVGSGHAGGFQAGAAHGQTAGLLGRRGKQRNGHAAVVLMCRLVVAAGHQGGAAVLHGQGVQQHIFLVIQHHAVHNVAAFRLVLRDVGRLVGIQHVHQDNGRNVENLETGANALAKGEVLEIVRIADGLHSLLVAVNQLGGVDRRRGVFRQVNGRRAENDLQASAALNGYGQAGGLLGVIYTVFVCHVVLPPV